MTWQAVNTKLRRKRGERPGCVAIQVAINPLFDRFQPPFAPPRGFSAAFPGGRSRTERAGSAFPALWNKSRSCGGSRSIPCLSAGLPSGRQSLGCEGAATGTVPASRPAVASRGARGRASPPAAWPRGAHALHAASERPVSRAWCAVAGVRGHVVARARGCGC